jgi:6-phosphogluconate dehydrogenase
VQIAMVGLGRMGGNMTTRLLQGGHEVVVYNRTREPVEHATKQGATGTGSLEELVSTLRAPRAVWTMVPAGGPTTEVIERLAELLEPGDVIVDGGNSHFTESKRRAQELSRRDISFSDAGTSGGIWGLEEGYCLMVGAHEDVFARLEPAFQTLAPPDGYAWVGPPGSGHFVKMVHNGVEYALMQAYGEGLEMLESSEFGLDVSQVAELWRHGSVVRSWLLDLAAAALERDPHLSEVAAYVEDSGEGRWTVQEAIERAVPAPTIAMALFARFASRQEQSYSARVLAALRGEFGGHAVRSAGTT